MGLDKQPHCLIGEVTLAQGQTAVFPLRVGGRGHPAGYEADIGQDAQKAQQEGVPDVTIQATLIPGDGIGTEIVEAVVAVLDALGAPFAWDVQQGGLAAIEAGGDPLPSATLDSIRRTKLALKGPLTTPVGGGFRPSMSGCARNSAFTPMSGLPAPWSPAGASRIST